MNLIAYLLAGILGALTCIAFVQAFGLVALLAGVPASFLIGLGVAYVEEKVA